MLVFRKFVDGGEVFINFNFRYPKGITPEEIEAGLGLTIEWMGCETNYRWTCSSASLCCT
jgi:hypothetical protein